MQNVGFIFMVGLYNENKDKINNFRTNLQGGREKDTPFNLATTFSREITTQQNIINHSSSRQNMLVAYSSHHTLLTLRTRVCVDFFVDSR